MKMEQDGITYSKRIATHSGANRKTDKREQNAREFSNAARITEKKEVKCNMTFENERFRWFM